MKELTNTSNFKCLELTTSEARHMGMGTVEGCICMNCNKVTTPTIYIAVLNDCMCPSCYKKWLKTAINYPEDRRVEARNYEYYLDKYNEAKEQ